MPACSFPLNICGWCGPVLGLFSKIQKCKIFYFKNARLHQQIFVVSACVLFPLNVCGGVEHALFGLFSKIQKRKPFFLKNACLHRPILLCLRACSFPLNVFAWCGACVLWVIFKNSKTKPMKMRFLNSFRSCVRACLDWLFIVYIIFKLCSWLNKIKINEEPFLFFFLNNVHDWIKL